MSLMWTLCYGIHTVLLIPQNVGLSPWIIENIGFDQIKVFFLCNQVQLLTNEVVLFLLVNSPCIFLVKPQNMLCFDSEVDHRSLCLDTRVFSSNPEVWALSVWYILLNTPGWERKLQQSCWVHKKLQCPPPYKETKDAYYWGSYVSYSAKHQSRAKITPYS